MSIISQVTEVFSDFQNEMNNLKVQNEQLRKENAELRRLLVAGEELRSQYVLCCAMNVKPEIIMQYVKSDKIESEILSDEEHKAIYDKGREDGYMRYQNLNPYEKGTKRFEIYESSNSMGITESDMEDGGNLKRMMKSDRYRE